MVFYPDLLNIRVTNYAGTHGSLTALQLMHVAGLSVNLIRVNMGTRAPQRHLRGAGPAKPSLGGISIPAWRHMKDRNVILLLSYEGTPTLTNITFMEELKTKGKKITGGSRWWPVKS